VREDRQYGLEPTSEVCVEQLRAVFAQLHRVVVDSGTVWLNLGDSSSVMPPGRTADPMHASTLSGTRAAVVARDSVHRNGVDRTAAVPLKNLIGMPWRVAFALQADGWIVRNAVVWHKPNAIPESAQDRLSTRYELLFLLVKRRKYWFDLDPIREPLARPEALTKRMIIGGVHKGRHAGVGSSARRRGHSVYGAGTRAGGMGRNPGDVWSIPTRPLREAHDAALPIDIPARCIAAGCPPGGVVLDPFSGAATTGLAARQLDHPYVGIDLNEAFHTIGLERLGLLADGEDGAAA
jgi:site-specific DNA-methyltransferase (cytosine-N4-specific)